MARKKLNISFTSPITILFALFCVTVFILEYIGFQGIIDTFFAVGGNASSTNPFNRFLVTDYITLFTHIFAHKEVAFLVLNTMCIVLLGPHIEHAYGKMLYVLMFIITAFITGILTTLFSSSSIFGSQGIVVLLFILSILAQAKTKTVPFSIIFASTLYIMYVFFGSTQTVTEKILPFIGALCASIFGFIDFIEQTRPIQRKKTVSTEKK